jgi:hypothetical protein
MKFQTPAEGIMLKKNFGNSIMYNIACDCGNAEDDIGMTVEADDCGVTVHHYVKVKTNWWTDHNKFKFISGFITRLKLTYSIWVNGYLEYESWTLMTEQQALNYSETLKSASVKVKEYKQKGK